MNEFSPGTLGTKQVRNVLQVLKPLEGDRRAMISGLIARYPKLKKTADLKQQAKRANNVLIGLSQCGLLETADGKIQPTLTEFANRLLGQSEADAAKHFAKHLLTDAHGLELLDVASTIRARGEALDDQAIREELRTRGFVVTENENNFSKIRMWLEGAGIVDEHWNVQEHGFTDIIGAPSGTVAKWSSLTRAQRVFAKQLRALTPSLDEWVQVRAIKRLCETSNGRAVFPEGKLREKVIAPLEAAELLATRGTGAGRGGDSGDVCASADLVNLKIDLPIEGSSGIPVDLRDKLSIPLETILSDLTSNDKNKSGLALELLALRLVRDLGLFPVCFRERSAKTQGAEVDLIVNGVHLHYSRWLVQCKNTSTVDVSDIAKEVGMAVVLKAQVIMMVTTGQFTKTTRTYASGLASSSALQAVLVDRDVLAAYRSRGPVAVLDWLRDTAFGVLALKQSQVHEAGVA